MVHAAHIRGESPEALASEVLPGRFSDPLLALSGCIRSHLNDVAERHDEYLGQGLAATHDEQSVVPFFADTSGWASFFVHSEPQHDLAEMLMEEIHSAGRVVTTSYILAELVALMISPLRIPHALRQSVVAAIREAAWVEVVHVDEQLDTRSWQFMARHKDKDFSLVDCSSFILMSDRGLSATLTTDRHFEQAGFVRLLKAA